MADDRATPPAPDGGPTPTGGQPDPSGASPGNDGPSAPESGRRPPGIDPQRLLRIAGVTREVLEEARRIRPEPAAVDHLRQVHDQIYQELRQALPPELYEELDDLTPEIRHGSLEELSLAHAEVLGWLEGLFQGTQLALQLQAAHAFAQRSGRPLPGREPGPESDPSDSRYL
jgi:acetoin utilization deacetylase AcuC-like enzyme